MKEPKAQIEPEKAQIVPDPFAPVPTAFALDLAHFDNGVAVRIRITTVTGVSVLFLDPASARRLGGQLQEAGAQAAGPHIEIPRALPFDLQRR